MAYLGFHEGGPKFTLATNAYTKEVKLFFPMAKTDFCGQKGHGSMPPNMQATVYCSVYVLLCLFIKCRTTMVLKRWYTRIRIAEKQKPDGRS